MFSMISSMVDTGSSCFLLVDDVFPGSPLVVARFSHVFLLFDHVFPVSPLVVARFSLLSSCFFMFLSQVSSVIPMFSPVWYCLSWFATCGGEVLPVILHCFPLSSYVFLLFLCFSHWSSARWWCPSFYLIRIAAILLTVWSCPVKHVCLSIFYIWWFDDLYFSRFSL